MKRGVVIRLPHQVEARADLVLVGIGVHDIEAAAEIGRQLVGDGPFILEIKAVKIAGLAGLVVDRERLIARLFAECIHREYRRGHLRDRLFTREEHAAAQRMVVG
jgi:hypothetical protein